MALVDAYAISFAAPLFMVALAVPMLGEQVGWRRWSAVAVGFVGVIVMLDPFGISFHAMSLIVLAATFCYALSTVMVRLTSQDGLPPRPAGRLSTQAIVGEGAPNAVREYLRTNLHTADKPPMLYKRASGPLAQVPRPAARIS